MQGLLSDLPRKNSWPIAEWAGESSPDGMQHLLGRARWDADRVRDDVREYVLEHPHDEDAVLVQRQYTETAGRIENAQLAVYLVYAGGGVGMRQWTVSCTSRARGLRIRTTAGPRAWARTPSSRPSPSWPPA